MQSGMSLNQFKLLSKKDRMDIDNNDPLENRYQVFVANIAWSSKATRGTSKRCNKSELPAHMSLDIPEAVLNEANKGKANFNDVVESFCYNLLSKKFGYEVTHCQVWLPLD